MNEGRVKDLELLDAINGCPLLAGSCVRAEKTPAYGLLVVKVHAAIGFWSWFDGAYRFRTLANWDPSRIEPSREAAVDATRAIAGVTELR